MKTLSLFAAASLSLLSTLSFANPILPPQSMTCTKDDLGTCLPTTLVSPWTFGVGKNTDRGEQMTPVGGNIPLTGVVVQNGSAHAYYAKGDDQYYGLILTSQGPESGVQLTADLSKPGNAWQPYPNGYECGSIEPTSSPVSPSECPLILKQDK